MRIDNIRRGLAAARAEGRREGAREPALRLSVFVAALALAGLLVSVAEACPNCRDALAGDPVQAGLVRGFFWSIIFMLSMPFLILAGLSSYFYWEVCRARRAAAQNVAAQNVAAQNVAAQNVAAQNVAAQNVAAQNVADRNVADRNVAAQQAAAQESGVGAAGVQSPFASTEFGSSSPTSTGREMGDGTANGSAEEVAELEPVA